MSDPKSPRAGTDPKSGENSGIRCDFCGEAVASVRRVALDRGYERLRTPHQPLYACAACSERKEQRRLGLERR